MQIQVQHCIPCIGKGNTFYTEEHCVEILVLKPTHATMIFLYTEVNIYVPAEIKRG